MTLYEDIACDVNVYLTFYVPLLCILQLIVCGQALSHCVKCTVEDIAEHWENQGGDRADLSRLYVLEDGKHCAMCARYCMCWV